MRWWLVVFTVAACSFLGEPDPEIVRLRERVQSLTKDLEQYEGKIREAGADPGLRQSLVNDQALLESRIERYREILRQKSGQ